MKIPLLAILLTLPLAAENLPSAQAMRAATDAFLESLDETQHKKATFPFADDARKNFRYTPQNRSGLPFKEMNQDQRTAAKKLLSAALSEKGLLKATQVMMLEGVLADLENNPERRDHEKYYFSIFGTPGEKSGWGWKFEGHHVSLNYTLNGTGQVSVTPSFFGANPAEVREGSHKGLRVLKAEDELGHKLLHSLVKSGRKDVVFSDKAPREVLTGEKRSVSALEPVGTPASEMSETQKKALLDLISEFTGRHRKDLAEADMKKIQAAGIDKIHFGWAGGQESGDAWYYRIQGPTFIMEAANTQNQANHIHLAWRDFDGDFGHDILSEHYHQHESP